jgi:predicted small lipoprotein YifL
MKNYSLLLLSVVVLTGCGQAGPLYLPDAPPPVHVEKPKEEKPKTEKPKTEQKAPTKNESEKAK